jgi:hypothetical protein
MDSSVLQLLFHIYRYLLLLLFWQESFEIRASHLQNRPPSNLATLPVQFALVILEMDYLPGLASNQDPLISVFQGARITVIEPQTLSQRPLQ